MGAQQQSHIPYNEKKSNRSLGQKRESGYKDHKISQLEEAYDRGLAGFREHLSQLSPEQKTKLMSAISKNIS